MDHPNPVGVATSVDLGPIPLDHAKSLQLALGFALKSHGGIWDAGHYSRCVLSKAMLDYKIAQAETTPSVFDTTIIDIAL